MRLCSTVSVGYEKGDREHANPYCSLPICGNHGVSAPVKSHPEISIRLAQYRISIYRVLRYVSTVVLAKAEVRPILAELNV